MKHLYTDGERNVVGVCLDILSHHSGHEIIRSVIGEIADHFDVAPPPQMFRVEHLHPPKATASVSAPGSSALPSPQKPSPHPSPQSPPPQSAASGPTDSGSQAPFSEGSSPKEPELPNEVRLDLHSVDLKLQHDRIEALEKHLALHVEPPDLDRLTFSERLVTATHSELRTLQAQCFERLEKLEKAKVETERRFGAATEWLANLEQWKADVAKDLENLDRLLQAHLKLHSQAEYPKTQLVLSDQVVGLTAGKEVDEVRFLTVKWQGDYWLLLRPGVDP